MSIQGGGTIAPEIGARSAAADRRRYLFGPAVDFFCLGGISLVLAPVLFLLPDNETTVAGTAAAMLVVANFVNHPHFAHSYQIFYRGFRAKAFGGGTAAGLRARYVFAGIVVPLALAGFLAGGLLSGNPRVLGLGGNLMAFLVGWHYVKQGYGMLMVDAALKRRFFVTAEKRLLLVNAYAVWVLSWLLFNATFTERALWGIRYFMIDVPYPVLATAFCAAFATTGVTLVMLAGKWRASDGDFPVNGLVAYLVSLYLWQLFVRLNALWLLVVPALHSLQYLVVVARYQVNRELADPQAQAPVGSWPLARLLKRRYQAGFAGFVAAGLVLGFVGFWGAPELLQAAFPYKEAVFGSAVFLFVFWIFINVHHYFLDNVMWRSENPDVRAHLFR